MKFGRLDDLCQNTKVLKQKLNDIFLNINTFLKGVLGFLEVKVEIMNNDKNAYDPFLEDSKFDNKTQEGYLVEINKLVSELKAQVRPSETLLPTLKDSSVQKKYFLSKNKSLAPNSGERNSVIGTTTTQLKQNFYSIKKNKLVFGFTKNYRSMSTLDAENLLRGKFNSVLSPINTKHLNTICSDKNFLDQFNATKSMIDENQETEENMPKLRPKDGISEKPYMSMEESTSKGFPSSMVDDIERRFGSNYGEKRGSVAKQYLWNSNFKKKLGGNEK